MFLGVRGNCSSQSHVTITFQNLQSVQPPETNWGEGVDFCGCGTHTVGGPEVLCVAEEILALGFLGLMFNIFEVAFYVLFF